MSAPLVFMDTETTGLSLDDDIWEFAAVRREPDGTESELHLFIEHSRSRCERLPESFREDHCNRYLDHKAVTRREACSHIRAFFDGEDQPHVVGAVPNFDTERLRIMRQAEWPNWPDRDPWHYHLIDVENLAVGYLYGKYEIGRTVWPPTDGGDATLALPWDSNRLSEQVGIDPEKFPRHTAMGDVRWAMAIYDAVTAS